MVLRHERVHAIKLAICSIHASHHVYRYLGTSAGVRPEQLDVVKKLASGLPELTRTALKPQQRMYLLRVHLLPSLHHQLVLERISKDILCGSTTW